MTAKGTIRHKDAQGNLGNAFRTKRTCINGAPKVRPLAASERHEELLQWPELLAYPRNFGNLGYLNLEPRLEIYFAARRTWRNP